MEDNCVGDDFACVDLIDVSKDVVVTREGWR